MPAEDIKGVLDNLWVIFPAYWDLPQQKQAFKILLGPCCWVKAGRALQSLLIIQHLWAITMLFYFWTMGWSLQFPAREGIPIKSVQRNPLHFVIKFRGAIIKTLNRWGTSPHKVPVQESPELLVLKYTGEQAPQATVRDRFGLWSDGSLVRDFMVILVPALKLPPMNLSRWNLNFMLNFGQKRFVARKIYRKIMPC